MAVVDRRIDWLCITCCSPSKLHITPDFPADLSTRKRDGFLIAAPGHHDQAIRAILLASAMAAILVMPRQQKLSAMADA
jgi:hypothetical protein